MSETDRFQAYSILDTPQVLSHLFHPRPHMGERVLDANREDIMIPVGDNVRVGASFHFSGPKAPTLLFFHGNGEIVSDYDDLGQIFSRAGMNFFVADYRGYGSSEGTPTVCSMLADSHAVLDFVKGFLNDKKLSGLLGVMGRSLGSASAIELAQNRSQDFDCLIIESGFAWIQPLLKLLGVYMEGDEAFPEALENVGKIGSFEKPTLVIHAQYDHIIPFSDGQALFEACSASDKTFLEIKNANHNDIFLQGMNDYIKHLQKLCRIN